jgi:hypothetical protein
MKAHRKRFAAGAFGATMKGMTATPVPYMWIIPVCFGIALFFVALLIFAFVWDWMFGMPPEDRHDR